MELSNYQSDMLEVIVTVAPKIILRKYSEDCCIASARILIEILKKLHFKDIKPLTVEASIFNEIYLKKGHFPQSDEEAQAWLAEGAWSIILGDRTLELPGKWPGHLVIIINGKYMVDLSIFQATRPQKNIYMDHLCAMVPESFIKGEDKCPMIFKNCLVVYTAFPQDHSYQKTKDWWDKKRSADIVSEIYKEVMIKLGKK